MVKVATHHKMVGESGKIIEKPINRDFSRKNFDSRRSSWSRRKIKNQDKLNSESTKKKLPPEKADRPRKETIGGTRDEDDTTIRGGDDTKEETIGGDDTRRIGGDEKTKHLDELYSSEKEESKRRETIGGDNTRMKDEEKTTMIGGDETREEMIERNYTREENERWRSETGSREEKTTDGLIPPRFKA